MKQLVLLSFLMLVLSFAFAQTYPLKTIAEVTNNNPDGTPASLNEKCELHGIVYGGNFRANGLQFTLIDSTNNGITVFSSTQNFGYTVKEGDAIAVRGAIGFFNGLTELILEEAIQVISSNNPLLPPTVIRELGENTESQLVKIENVTLSNPSQWTNAGTAFNADVTNGFDLFQLRITNVTDIFGTSAPSGTFSIVGLGNQFDRDAPYDSGYQLFPRYLADFQGATIGGAVGYPKRSVGEMTTTTTAGIADSLGKRCELEGIVYGINLSETGLQFTMIDEQNNGIGVFKGGENLGYTVKEGDKIAVKGVIDQFRGLIQMELDSLELISTDNPLAEPIVVNELSESTESQLIRLGGVAFLPNLAQWSNMGAGFNVDIQTAIGNFVMRIDDQSDLFGENPPITEFVVTGLGGQFDTTEPLTEGYQIIPRYKEDITVILGTKKLNLAQWIQFYPNPTQQLMFINTDVELERIVIFDAAGKKILEAIGNQNQLDLSVLPAGNYTLSFQNKEGIWASHFVKQ
ncbi:MAG: T9SS type A sorting domain-containing protein [Saprospiraceae bacterium]|nr:T9SS type A sorting domain-containing protein [Saprospiraceae bacterium]